MLTAMSSHHWYLMWQPLAVKRARTRRGIPSSGVVTLLVRTAAHAWRTVRRNSGTVACLGSRPSFGHKHSQWGSGMDSELASPWLPHPVLPEKQSCHVLCGGGIFLDIQLSSRNSRRPGKHTIVEKPDSVDQFTPPTMVNGTPYHDSGAIVTICGLDAHIYRPLPLPESHTSAAITVKQSEARVITEDTVPVVPEVPPSRSLYVHQTCVNVTDTWVKPLVIFTKHPINYTFDFIGGPFY